MRSWHILAACVLITTGARASEPAAPLSALAKLPVKEITVFKDGHAFVLHEGRMPVDGDGNVQMDYLPTPILGAFWPYSADKRVKLVAVTASPHRVLVERTALSVRELLEASPGTEVKITQTDGKSYDAQIVGVPTRSAQELEATSPPNSPPMLPEKGNVILLKTAEGVAVVGFDQIRDVTFNGAYKPELASEEFRNLLTLKLDWPGGHIGKTADVGMVYVQKGVRWIPEYKVTIDGKGMATVQLQATLLNEMTDLNDVTANLVVGVPSFFFKDMPDPMSLQQTFAQLSQYFQPESRTGYAFSNALMSQAARAPEGFGGGLAGPQGPAGPPGEVGGGGEPGPEVTESGRNEDLYVFTVKHVTLKKDQRMVLPIAEYTLPYKDVFTLDLPFAPPPEMRNNINSEQQAELARLLNAPQVLHKIRLTNKNTQPLTTAPALILSGDRVLGQGMMTYTAIGSETDLTLTAAPDIRVKKTDKETQRTPDAVTWQNQHYMRIDLAGTIHLTDYRDQAVDLEVTRNVLGNVGKADHGGVSEMVNVFEDDSYLARSNYFPSWWGYYNWPYWWSHFNGIGRITWKLHLEPKQTLDLNYTWFYYWQ